MKRLYIEAGSLAEPRTSGIGNTTLNIVRTLASDDEINKRFQIHLIVAFNKAHYLERYHLDGRIRIRKLYIPGRVMNLLTRHNIIPWMDVLLGKGVYLFPNYKNWPLMFSKSITYIHDMAFLRHPEFIQERNLSYLQSNIGRWLKRTDQIVTVSAHAKSELDHYFPEYANKSSFVYNGIDLQHFYPDNSNHQQLLSKYGLEKEKYFIFLSNLEPRKNVQGLLEAYRLFCEQNATRSYKLLLVGGMGWKNEEIVETIRSLQENGLPVVRPDAFVPDEELPGLLNGSVGLVHPAFYEGFGISPLQAMACGKFVVVGRNSSLPEVVGDEAIYVDEHDPRAIAAGMTELVGKMGVENTKGATRAKEFSWNTVLVPLVKDILSLEKDI